MKFPPIYIMENIAQYVLFQTITCALFFGGTIVPSFFAVYQVQNIFKPLEKLIFLNVFEAPSQRLPASLETAQERFWRYDTLFQALLGTAIDLRGRCAPPL